MVKFKISKKSNFRSMADEILEEIYGTKMPHYEGEEEDSNYERITDRSSKLGRLFFLDTVNLRFR